MIPPIQTLSLCFYDVISNDYEHFLTSLKDASPAVRLKGETALQLALNRGMMASPIFLDELQKLGYLISYNFSTIERFHTFSFPGQPDLQEAIRCAAPSTGLLVDRNKMYRPGPASAKDCNGAAKGYDEIFAVFEQQTTEKKRIAQETCNFITLIEENLSNEHPWKDEKVLLDMACGNGVQINEVLNLYPCRVIGIDNQAGCIDHCKELLPKQTFEVQDVLAEVPSHLQQKANILFVSHFYCPSEKAAILLERLKKIQASENTLLIFVNGCTGSDGDRIANKLPFLRGKPSNTMSSDFKKALATNDYTCIEKISEAKVVFPNLTPAIKSQLLNIRRGDYENPYNNIDPNLKTTKALMEFIASFPLESMKEEEIALYLDELEKIFKANGGPYLKICNQMLFAHPKNADKLFRAAFKQAETTEKNPYFEQIQEKIDAEHFKEAKQDLGNLLENLEDQDLENSIIGFQLMSHIHLYEEKYPEAAGLFWYAKRLSTDKAFHIKIDRHIEMIERTLLQKQTHQEGPIKGIDQAKTDQEKLKSLREKINNQYSLIKTIEDNFERAKALRILYQETITNSLKTYIHELAQDVILQMQVWGKKIPCQYALIGLGSLAREEMTPYSDFEFAILIDSEKEEDKKYFRLFCNLLHLRFINLGETILPSLDIRNLSWVFDTITPRGLSFDGSMPTACKTGIGKINYQKGDYELIHNPEKMSELQFVDVTEDEHKRLWILQRYHLPSILSVCTFVTGSEKGIELVTEYQEKVQKILQKEGKQRALNLMQDDLKKFKPCLEDTESGKNYKVKYDLYRLPNTMFDGLANYFCLKSGSTWERIEELETKGIFAPDAAKDLKELIMLSQELRLSTYLNHGCQKEHLDLDTKKIHLKELYYRVLPFTEMLEAFCKEMTKTDGLPENSLKKERFYDNSLYYQGIIAFRHMEYFEADDCLSRAKLDTLSYYEFLGAVKDTLGKYQEAENAYLMAIEKEPSCDLFLKLGLVRQSLGRYKKEKSAEEAFFKAKELAEISSDQLLMERAYRALTILYKECGDYELTRKYLGLCKEKCKNRTVKKTKDAEYGVVLDLDLARTKELEAEILKDLDSKFEKSGKLFHQAYHIFQGYYRRDDHPTILGYDCDAHNPEGRLNLLKRQKKILKRRLQIFGERHPDVMSSYSNLGYTLFELSRYEEALEYESKSLKMLIELFGEKHLSVATSYNNIGNLLVELGKYEEPLKHHKKALEIFIEVFGENHSHVAHSYNCVGSVLGKLGKHEEALKYEIKSLEIRIQIYGKKHPDVAASYNNIGSTLQSLGLYDEALETSSKALRMLIEIFGEKYPNVAYSYNTVGSVLGKLGKHEKALKHHEKALKILIEIFGEKHIDVACSYGNVGFSLGCLSRHEESLEYKKKSLEMRIQLLGENHPDVASSYNNVGGTLLELEHYFEALHHLKKSLDIYQGHYCFLLHPDTANIHRGLRNCCSALKDNKKALEHKKESKNISRELDNRKAFQKEEPFFLDFLHKREYQKAYSLLTKLPRFLQEAPDFLCVRLQTALLCPELTTQVREKLIQNIEAVLNKKEGSILTQVRLSVNLASYWFTQNIPNKWEKIFECIKHLKNLQEIAPTLQFRYEFLDLLAFKENLKIEGECILVEILCHFMTLKVYQGQKKSKILVDTIANQLLEKIKMSGSKGDKIEEIKSFCFECLNQKSK